MNEKVLSLSKYVVIGFIVGVVFTYAFAGIISKLFHLIIIFGGIGVIIYLLLHARDKRSTKEKEYINK